MTMMNPRVKLAILASRYQKNVTVRDFMQDTPLESIARFRELLPAMANQALSFAFSDAALLLILQKEFEIPVSSGGKQVVFKKGALDAESWLYASGIASLPSLPGCAELIDTLTETLWRRTGMLVPIHTPLDERVLLRRELHTLLSLYFLRYGKARGQYLKALENSNGFKHFLNQVVAEAIYKADGACALFGPDALYTRLWREKQAQYFAFARYIATSPIKHLAS